MENMQIFSYEGSSMTFENKDGKIMVNATEMAKPFGKRPGKWLELPSTKEFIQALETVRKSDSLFQTKEGVNGGTWMHEDVALEFARWLSPKFAIWCNDRIKELMRFGITATPSTLDEMVNNPDLIIGLATKLKEERAEKERLQAQTELQQKELSKAAPKVEYYNNVLQSESLIATNVIAKELGMSAISLNKILHEKGVIYNQSGTWLLYFKYQNLGYTGTKTHTYKDSSGIERSSVQTYWTERGRQFVHNMIKSLKSA